MAVYRQVQTAFWQDEFVLQLTPEEKYFYLYLLTNSKTKQCGIYQLPMQVIIMETGYNQETAEKLLKRFWDYGKIIYNIKTKEIALLNWPKYNPMESPKTRACVEKELKEVKDKSLIGTVYPARCPIQGVSQEEEAKEKTEAEEEGKQLKIKNDKLKSSGEQGGLKSTAAAAAIELISKETHNVILSEAKNPAPFLHHSNNPSIQLSDDHPDYKGASIQMQSELLFIRIWNKQKPNPQEVRIAASYIEKFSFSEVEIAFTEAVKYDKKKLAYVETVCERRKERADLVKKNELERVKRIEQDKKLEEERKSGISLGLIKTVFGDR